MNIVRSQMVFIRSSIRLAALLGFVVCMTLGCSQDKEPLTLGKLVKPLFPPSPSEVASDAFNPDDADLRREAITRLSAAPFGGEETYVRIYRMMLGSTNGDSIVDSGPDPDATVRSAALKALGMHGTVDDAQLIIPMLEDEYDFVRWEAAIALQRIHNPAAVLPLIKTLANDEDSDVRMATAAALGQYTEPAVFDALLGALDDRQFGVIEAARVSLTTLTGYDFGIDASLWLLWADKNRGRLFEKHRIYVWQPYQKPPTLLDKAKFWQKPKNTTPRIPTGYEIASKPEI